MKFEALLKQVALEHGFTMEDHERTIRSLRSTDPGMCDREVPPEMIEEMTAMCHTVCEFFQAAGPSVAQAFIQQEREKN